MMTEIRGDLFSTEAPLIAHGVNCQGKFGAGVAAQIAERWPVVKERYLCRYDKFGWGLGEVQVVGPLGPFLDIRRYVANLATQDRYGRPRPGDPPFASKMAIHGSVRRLFDLCRSEYQIDRVAMPRIGCGLGGLEWDLVRPVIAKLADEFEIEVEAYFNG